MSVGANFNGGYNGRGRRVRPLGASRRFEFQNKVQRKQKMAAGLCGTVWVEQAVEYFAWDEAEKQLVAKTCSVYTVMTADCPKE